MPSWWLCRPAPAARWVRALGLGGAIGVCAGCGSSPLTETGDGRRVVIGTGEAEFEPMSGEPRLPLAAGVQGGFHVWASFLAYGFESDRVDMVLETRVEEAPESSLVMQARLMLRDGLDASGESVRWFAGYPAQVYDARCAHGRRVRLSVTLADADGSAASDSRTCIAELEPQQRSSDCD